MNPDASTQATIPTRGEAFERLAFTFCKIATLCLLTGPYALLVASAGAAIFFALGHFNGKRDTRCIGKHPLLIALFWAVVFVVALYFKLK